MRLEQKIANLNYNSKKFLATNIISEIITKNKEIICILFVNVYNSNKYYG